MTPPHSPTPDLGQVRDTEERVARKRPIKRTHHDNVTSKQESEPTVPPKPELPDIRAFRVTFDYMVGKVQRPVLMVYAHSYAVTEAGAVVFQVLKLQYMPETQQWALLTYYPRTFSANSGWADVEEIDLAPSTTTVQ